MGVAPAFLGPFMLETLHGADPFRAQLGDFPQLGGGSEPAGLEIFANGFPFGARRGPLPTRRKRLDEIGQAYADEMVLQSPFFKPEAGGGEV